MRPASSSADTFFMEKCKKWISIAFRFPVASPHMY